MNHDIPNELPHPEIVLRAAQEEQPPRLLDDYAEAICELKEKKFTFREIAEWLEGFGFKVNHNAVYRAYAKAVPKHVLAQEEVNEERLERDEALRDHHLNGPLPASNPNPATQRPVELPAKARAVKPARKPAKAKKN